MKVLLLLENYSTSGTTNLEILGFNVFVVVSFCLFFLLLFKKLESFGI